MQHLGASSWAADIAFIEIDRFSSFEELRIAEKVAIIEERPIHNLTKVALAKRPRVKSARPRGRPPILDDRPWDLEGISRRTWYRKKSQNFC